MYGRGFIGSTTEKFGEKFVPAPFAAVFQPANVYPALTIVPTVGRLERAIGETLLISKSLVLAVELLLEVAGDPDAPLVLYVMVAVHFA
jgi:hypothetical protein